jgi:hypothetical protein
MGAMKQFYTASLEYDRDTGASLCARPEWRQRDMRPDEWDTELDWSDSRPLAAERRTCECQTPSMLSQGDESR